MKVSVVTDSTCDLPQDLARASEIRVVPLKVRFDADEFIDGVTIDSDEFYRRLEHGPGFPATSQPSAGDFLAVYRELAQTSEAIISLHLSSGVSGTCASAIQARAEMRGTGCRIEVIDTRQASMSLGLIVLEAARAAREGADADETLRLAESLVPRARLFGLVDTLEYLRRGGRIGRAQALLGSLLQVHPILTLQDGIAHPLERPRTRARGVARLKAIAAQAAPLQKLAVMYSTDEAPANDLVSEISHLVPDGDVVLTRFGPILGTYLGPGALGVSLISERPV